MTNQAGLFDTLRQQTDAVRHRVDQARQQARQVAREMSRNLANAREEAESTARTLGLPIDQAKAPVIDVGDKPNVMKRLGNALAAATLAVLIAGSLLSFGSFLFQFLLATLIASRILGLKLDLGAAGARA